MTIGHSTDSKERVFLEVIVASAVLWTLESEFEKEE